MTAAIPLGELCYYAYMDWYSARSAFAASGSWHPQRHPHGTLYAYAVKKVKDSIPASVSTYVSFIYGGCNDASSFFLCHPNPSVTASSSSSLPPPPTSPLPSWQD